jgi:hypothetical protein
MTKTTLVKFNTQNELDEFVRDNFVEPADLKFPLEAGKTYRVVDDDIRGWWIELAD